MLTEFHTTFKMSCYLLAWAIVPNDFQYRSIGSENGKEVRNFANHKTSSLSIEKILNIQQQQLQKKIRVYARKQAVEKGYIDFALNMAKRALDFYENIYFEMSMAVPPKIGEMKFKRKLSNQIKTVLTTTIYFAYRPNRKS